MVDIRHRAVTANGIRLHFAESGPADGPCIILCHGFPESWYSWRHQLKALGEAGYHVVAPDMRGFGRSSHPLEVSAFTQPKLVGDMVGLLAALPHETAVIAGHDWGAPVAWNAALFRPELFPAVIGLSVPFYGLARLLPTIIPSRRHSPCVAKWDPMASIINCISTRSAERKAILRKTYAVGSEVSFIRSRQMLRPKRSSSLNSRMVTVSRKLSPGRRPGPLG